MGIMPYISASIVMQLAAIAVPSIQKLQQEGESGRRKIDQWTRYLTVVLLLVQGSAYLVNLNMQLRQAGAHCPRTVVRYLCDRRHGCRQYVRPLAW